MSSGPFACIQISASSNAGQTLKSVRFSIYLIAGAHKAAYISLFQQKNTSFTCPPLKHWVSLGFSRANALSAPDNSSKATMPWFQTQLDTSWEAGPKISKANRQKNHNSWQSIRTLCFFEVFVLSRCVQPTKDFVSLREHGSAWGYKSASFYSGFLISCFYKGYNSQIKLCPNSKMSFFFFAVSSLWAFWARLGRKWRRRRWKQHPGAALKIDSVR